MFSRFCRFICDKESSKIIGNNCKSFSSINNNSKWMFAAGTVTTVSLTGAAAYNILSPKQQQQQQIKEIQTNNNEVSKIKEIANNNNNKNKFMKRIITPGIEPYSLSTKTTHNHATDSEIEEITNINLYKDKYPEISINEVRKHYSPFVGDGRVWVTWKGGIYDVTDFMNHHPGGSTRIEMVGGNDLNGYWKIYTLHKRKHIQKLLQKYRIGNLSEKDRIQIESESHLNNHYISDPPRDPLVSHADTITNDLIIASLHPYNAEPRNLKILSDNFYTPNDLFWVRNHNAVPLIDENEYILEISNGNDENENDPIELTLEDLKTKFKKYEIPVTIQCAGNRQEDYNDRENNPLYVAPHWHNTAIGNALWGGCKLRDVLEYIGLDVNKMVLNDEYKTEQNINWVSFIGADEDETGVPYGGMIPIEKAIDPWGDCLLVYEMNGTELPRDHGYPIRLIAPGHAGCRQVKWVKEIQLLSAPSELDSGSKLDRHFAPNICFDQLSGHELDSNDELAPVIQTLPVQSIICDWELNCSNNTIIIRGVAWAGGGKGIARVDVSIDGGKIFKSSKLITPISTTWNRNWSWIHFESQIKLNKKQIELIKKNKNLNLQLISKAVDDNFNAQPENMKPYYNVLGVCINHWKRVNVTINNSQGMS